MYAKEVLEKLKSEWEIASESVFASHDCISKLYEDWHFLDNFYLDVDCSNLDSGIEKQVADVSHIIGNAISHGGYGRNEFVSKFSELFSVLIDCRIKTAEILIPATAEALKQRFKVMFERRFMDLNKPFHMNEILYNLELIKSVHGFEYEPISQLSFLQPWISWIELYLKESRSLVSKFEDHPFLAHMESTVSEIAFQLFDFWISRNDAEIAKVKAAKFVDLRKGIDLWNVEFLSLFLSFQVTIPRRAATLHYFCSFLLCQAQDVSGYQDIENELHSLVRNYTLHENGTDHSRNSTLFHQLILRILALMMEVYVNMSLDLIDIDEEEAMIVDLRTSMDEARGYIKYITCASDVKKYSILVEEMNDEVESLVQRSGLLSKEQKLFSAKYSVQQLLYKIMFFRADSFLLELLQTGQSDEITSLVAELACLKALLSSQLLCTSRQQQMVSTQIKELTKAIALVYFSTFQFHDIDNKLLLSLPKLLDKVRYIKAVVEMMSPSLASSNFPSICGPGFIKFLGRSLRELLEHDPMLVSPLKNQLMQVEQQLEPMGSLLSKTSVFDSENGDLKDIGDRIRQTVHKLAYIVESIEFDDDSSYSFWLSDLLEDITAINQQLSCSVSGISNAVMFKTLPLVSGEILSKDTDGAMVDLIDEEKAIINQLMRGSSQRDVVSIVGMAGIGKTTLARKVFNSKNAVYHFPHRAWCTVSQAYSKRELLVEIIRGIHGNAEDIHDQTTDDELQSKLRKYLLAGNRYLIVLDDVWDVEVWDYLQVSFPTDSNGSRIMITSRLQDLHLKIKPRRDPHLMHLFSDEESWMLLEKKIFGQECVSCPKDLVPIGTEIARRCEGLPLAVVAVAGLLRKKERTRECWENISRSLSTLVINDLENKCRKILELSYKHLPDDLKACFLYMGVFTGDRDITVSKLIQFWMAEGLVHEPESTSLEEVAHECLMELINRSLVTVTKKGSNGNVKACRLHDLLRDLCQSKAKDENFLHLVTRYDEPYASIPGYEYDLEFQRNHALDPVTFESYRLSINLKRNHFFDSRPSGPRTRSLIFFASADKEPRRPYEITFICKNFRLLRVLDLECINMGVGFPEEIGLMVQLRYLAVSAFLRSIPPSIANLWRLQFLVVKGFSGTVSLPYSIWTMKCLRHLHVNEHVSFDFKGEEEEEEEEFNSLYNLVSFSTPAISYGDSTINIFMRLPNLLKMRCMFFESSDSSFEALELLTQLESLKIIYIGRVIHAGEFLLPMSLKKLTLSKFWLSWNHVSGIGGLPNLRVLKFLSGEFEGPRWEMKEGEFARLEFLKLEALNITEWDAVSDHIPRLRQLTLCNCKNLEEIPEDFACISTLEMILVQWCGTSVEKSAKSIGDVAEEIKVILTH